MSDANYGRGLYVFVGLATASDSPTSDGDASTWATKPLPGQRGFETDTGDLYRYNGADWQKIGTTTSSGEAAGLVVVEFLSESAIINNQNYYIGWKSQKAGTNKNRVQLLNPAASGKTLILSAIWLVFQANDDEVQIRFNRGSAVGAINSVPINTYLGGAASVATIYTANTTSVDGTYGFDIEPSIGAAASGDGSVVINIIETTGMVIPAGGDIILVNNTATNDITVGFSYKEVTA